MYFITICTYQRQCLLGEIVDGEMQLSEFGQIVSDTYLWLASQYPYVYLDQWIVMPNHLHGIIGLTADSRGVANSRKGGSRTALTRGVTDDSRGVADDSRGVTDDSRRGGSRTAPTDGGTKRKPLGRLIGAFKTVSTKHINILRDTPGTPVWQRNYYEHIIRNEEALQQIRQYIRNNPLSWQKDRSHPDYQK